MMLRIALAAIMVASITGVVALTGILPTSAQATVPSAMRSINPATVAPGGTVTVTIEAADYGQAGGVTETLPPGFAYVDSSLSASQVYESGQDVRFTLQGDTSVTYTVTASGTAGSYSFSGTLRDFERDDYPVDGDSSVTVEAPSTPSTPTPSATRSINPATVAPGGTVTVTIEAADYGQAGGVTETLPPGFAYVDSSLSASQVYESGQDVRFTLQDETSVTYTVTASGTAGSYSFSGTLRDFERDDYPVGGDSSVTVEAPSTPSTPTPSATRSINPATVAPGGTVTVTIEAADYGQAGGVTETLPPGFAYVDSSLSASQVYESGQDVRFTLQDETSFTYTVTASGTAGSYSFSGTLRDFERDDYPVGGASRVTVRVVAPEPDPEPQVNRDPAFPGSSTTRSVDENSASGANVGAQVRATDADGDRLTYSLTGTDAGSFTINSSGQIMVGTGTMLDFEDKASYTITVRATDPDNASDTISVTVTVGNVDEQGTVTLNPDRPLVGTALTASLTDPDGGVTGETWRWSRSDAADGTFTGIRGATRASYTPVEADEGMYLKITVTYTDGHGPNKTATASAMVPPPSNSPPRFSETAPTRSIAENSAAGTAVGAPVRATDPDRDSLTYTLGGSDAATFSIGRTSGQLMARAALDYETKPSYSVGVTARDNRGGSDTTTVAVAVTNVEEQGTVTLNPDRPLVGTALTASLTDPDGGVTGETWRWSRSDAADGTFTGIGGATRASYTPVEADDGMYLKITVTYTDGHGPNKTATAGAMVSDPLIARYDANKDGTIEIRELFNAIDHYFDGTIEIRELFKVIDYYFDG